MFGEIFYELLHKHMKTFNHYTIKNKFGNFVLFKSLEQVHVI